MTSSPTFQKLQVVHLGCFLQPTKNRKYLEKPWLYRCIIIFYIKRTHLEKCFMLQYYVTQMLLKRQNMLSVFHCIIPGSVSQLEPWPWTLAPSPLPDVAPPGSCWGLLRSRSSAGPSGSSAAAVWRTWMCLIALGLNVAFWRENGLTCSEGDWGRGKEPSSFRCLLVSLASWFV